MAMLRTTYAEGNSKDFKTLAIDKNEVLKKKAATAKKLKEEQHANLPALKEAEEKAKIAKKKQIAFEKQQEYQRGQQEMRDKYEGKLDEENRRKNQQI